MSNEPRPVGRPYRRRFHVSAMLRSPGGFGAGIGPDRDPFGLGGRPADPVVLLGDELNALGALMETCPESWADEFSKRMVAKEDQIAAAVPTSASGVAVQLRLLVQWASFFDWDDPLEEFADKLIARLEQLGAEVAR